MTTTTMTTTTPTPITPMDSVTDCPVPATATATSAVSRASEAGTHDASPRIEGEGEGEDEGGAKRRKLLLLPAPSPLVSAASPIPREEHVRLEGLLRLAQGRASLDRLAGEAAAEAEVRQGGRVTGVRDGKKKGFWKQRSFVPGPAPVPEAPATNDATPAEKRMPKRKVALLLGYSGTGYSGMQINQGTNTIELELHKALAMAGAVSQPNAMDAFKLGFMRCARTDKGVHAAGQVCSLKMCIEEPDIVSRINAHLPPQIRIWGGCVCLLVCVARV
jgi:hypothetical protein